MRPGDPSVPIIYEVDRIRDGRSFTTRRVVAHQSGEAIFNMSASFAQPEEGIAHQSPMPEAPPPEGLEDWEDMRARVLGDPEAKRTRSAVEVRLGDPYHLDDPDARYEPRQRNWLRVKGTLPDEPLTHTEKPCSL